MPHLINWLKACEVCPNFCRVNRLAGEKGRCRVGAEILVSQACLHFGEEPMLVGHSGSGTIFFTACNLECVFCQNYDISQLDYGRKISPADLLRLIFALEKACALNINLVSPTHQAPQIFTVIKQAKEAGLKIPVVYNCGGYENPDFLKELEGLVDIYMPDFKYGTDERAQEFSKVANYVTWAQQAIKEMYRQVGDLKLNSAGIATGGLLVRHLVLPGLIEESKAVLDFLASAISLNTVINIMDQYQPSYKAHDYPLLRRRVFKSEVDEVREYAEKIGFRRILS